MDFQLIFPPPPPPPKKKEIEEKEEEEEKGENGNFDVELILKVGQFRPRKVM